MTLNSDKWLVDLAGRAGSVLHNKNGLFFTDILNFVFHQGCGNRLTIQNKMNY